MKLSLHKAALSDLDDILDYTLAAHGAAQAEAYVRSLWAAMESLLSYPNTGAPSDRRPGLRSFPAGGHRIYYRVEDDAVVVVRVLHKRMDAGRLVWV